MESTIAVMDPVKFRKETIVIEGGRRLYNYLFEVGGKDGEAVEASREVVDFEDPRSPKLNSQLDVREEEI
jgi:hypothetical protein